MLISATYCQQKWRKIYVHSYVYYHCWSYTYINLFLGYQLEPLYGTPFQEINLSSTLVDYWRTGNNETTSLHLPGTNQFFPKDLNLLQAPENASKIPVEIPIDSKYDHRSQKNSATSNIFLSHPRLYWCIAVVVAGHGVPWASCLPPLWSQHIKCWEHCSMDW